MGKMWRRSVALVTVVLAFPACGPWPEKLDTAIPCDDGRLPVTGTIGREGGSLTAPYARAEFDAGTFTTPTRVVITPYPGLHGFHIDFPDEPDTESPPFRAYFYLDACDTPPRESYRIATRERIAPAMIRRDAPRQEPTQTGRAAWREIAPGELDDELDGAGFTPLPPIHGGFVVLSN